MDFELRADEKRAQKRLKENLAEFDGKGLWGPFAQDPEDARAQIKAGLKKTIQAGYLEATLETGPISMVLKQDLAFLSPPLYLAVEGGIRALLKLIQGYGHKVQDGVPKGLMEGNLVVSFGVLEGHGNLEDNPLKTCLEAKGDHFSLSGEKHLVPLAAMADLLVVASQMGDGVAFVVMVAKQDGLQISPDNGGLGPMGLFGDLKMEGMVPKEPILIGPGRRDDLLSTYRMWEDEMLIGLSLGIMQRAFKQARQHAKLHTSGGRPILSYQEVGFKLAEMLTLIQASQYMAYRAAWAQQWFEKEYKALLLCSKVLCGESCEKVVSEAMQVLGINAFSRDRETQWLFMLSKFVQVNGTSVERSRIKLADILLEGV